MIHDCIFNFNREYNNFDNYFQLAIKMTKNDYKTKANNLTFIL